MATSSFKSTSRRGTATEPKAKAPPPAAAAASRRRSHSVSAVSRKIHVPFDDDTPISTEFSNSRENPLFWSRSSLSPDKGEEGGVKEIASFGNKISSSSSARSASNGGGGGNSSGEQRGRSVTRSVSHSNGIGRSVSRVRGRSVSTVSRNRAYESEKEQVPRTSTTAQSRNETKRSCNGISRTNSVRNRVNNPGQAKHAGVRTTSNQANEWSEDDSACSMQVSNLEDGFSVGSLSEAEEKTIRTAFEELNVFQRNTNQTARTNVSDVPSDIVNPEAVELILDIRREYAGKLEESEERARKLRADLAIEEHRGQELDRVLKEILPERKNSDVQRSRRARKTSNERKRMSNRLTEDAMAYFDECISLSTFDSSDFSASEDPPYSLVGSSGPVDTAYLANGSPSTLGCYSNGSLVDHNQVQLKVMPENPEPTPSSSSADQGSSQLYQFSFADKRSEVVKPQEDLRSYIKHFEREAKKDTDLEAPSSYYDAEEYRLQGQIEGALFDRVLYSSRIESGGLLLCGGAISYLPFASVL